MRTSAFLCLAFPAMGFAQSSWTCTVLHPAASHESYATAIDKGVIGGSSRVLGEFAHATLWVGSAFTHVDLTPLATENLELYDVHGDIRVGNNQFNPFQARLWNGNSGSPTPLMPGGSALVYATYGNEQVGDYDETFIHKACRWNGTSGSFVSMHPLFMQESSAYGVFRGIEVGAAKNPDTGKWNACAWEGDNNAFVNLHPAGAQNSGISGIWDQGRVGSTWTFTNKLAHLWLGTTGLNFSMHPAGAQQSQMLRTFAGIHTGWVKTGGVSRAAVWTGLSTEPEDLSLDLPSGYSDSSANDVWCDATTTYVVGWAINSTTLRSEAVMWSRPNTAVSMFGQLLIPDVADPSTTSFDFEYYQDGEHVATIPFVYPNIAGYFYANGVLHGEFDVYVKGGTFLRKLVSGVIVSDLDPGPVYFQLTNGDIDNDNEVGPGDFGRLSSAFGTVDGDSNWDLNADLDQDGEVGPSDFGILSANFGLAGD